jgi:hypothetical protein
MASDYGISSGTSPDWRQVTITDASATTLFTVDLAAGEWCGGLVNWAVFASDGTDFQVISGIATYAAENKGGTIVGAFVYDSANEAKAVSSGTLTLAFTDAETDNPDSAAFKVQPTGSLTETTMYIRYQIVSQFGNKITTAV